MTKLPIDQSQRERAKTELDRCFLVEAAAGTGKTTLLIDRIMALLRGNQATLPEIAAITFTEKAAGELKVRLRQVIEAELRECQGKDRAIFSKALSDLDAMTVATIHSFCSELIRARPVEAGVEPNFTLADELTNSRIFREAWEEWLTGQMTPENETLKRALQCGISYGALRGNSQLMDLARLLNEQRDLVPNMMMDETWDDARFAAEIERLRSTSRKLAEMREQSCADFSDKGATQIVSIAKWADALKENDFTSLLAWLRQYPGVRVSWGNKKNWSPPEIVPEMKALAVEFKHRAETIQLQAGHRVLCGLVAWIQPFLSHYTAARAQHRMLDFQDLLILARDMLKQHRGAREYFKRAWRYLLVDEFQDTDPLQTEIVFFLSERKGEFAGEWDKVNLIPGKLFLVGDPKQSIYGFRRADLDLYGQVKNILAQQGDILSLSVNFRTVPGILREVNRVFTPLMTGPVDGRFEPTHVNLAPYREADNACAGVRFISPPAGTDTKKLKADEWRRMEFGGIAACINDLIAQGTSVYDRSNKSWRKLRYRDIAILFRAMTGLELLENALRAHHVPYQVAGGKHYYARLEFQDLLCVLRAVENPCDGLSIYGALRSPFFGHADQDLLRHHAAGGRFNYLEAMPAESSALDDAFQTLAQLHAMRNAAPIGVVMNELFARTQALQIYAMKPHGEQRVANLLKVIEMGRALEKNETLSFGAFTRWLVEMENAQPREGESLMAEADENFVQLLTFHKAKGLEYPVIFLADLATGHHHNNPFVFNHAAKRLNLKFGDNLKSAGWEAASADKKIREEYESRRLFYVAMTRARDLLVLPAYWAKSADQGMLAYLNRTYPSTGAGLAGCDPDMRIPTEAYDRDKKINDDFISRPEITEKLPPEAERFQAHRRAWKKTLRARANTLNTAKKIMTPSGMVAQTSPSNKFEGATQAQDWQKLGWHTQTCLGVGPDLGAANDHGGPTGADIGTLVHQVLEVVDFSNPGDIPAVTALQARHLELNLQPDELQTAANLAKAALQLPLLAERATRANVVCKETPFALDDGKTLWEGRVDLLFVENDGAVIVDYKTDAVSATEAVARAEHYRPQAELYARAMNAALDIPVKETYFLFIRPGVAVPIMI